MSEEDYAGPPDNVDPLQYFAGALAVMLHRAGLDELVLTPDEMNERSGILLVVCFRARDHAIRFQVVNLPPEEAAIRQREADARGTPITEATDVRFDN